jgi:hypothetical protein
MKFAINDLAFNCQSATDYQAIVNIKTFISLVNELKKKGILSEIYSDKKFRGVELAPNYLFEQMLNDRRLTNEERTMLKTIITKSLKITPIEGQFIEVGGEKSSVLASSYIGGMFVISLRTNIMFEGTEILGVLNNQDDMLNVKIKNLSEIKDIDRHKNDLDIKKYEFNPKHKVNGGWGSPMDLPDDVAQMVLDTAIPFPNNKDHYVNIYNNKYYSYRKHHDNYFHGYIDNGIPPTIQKLLKIKET